MNRHHHCRRIGVLLVLAMLSSAGALSLAGAGAGSGQEGSPLAIGTLRTLHSEILKEDRPLSIRLPDDYARNKLSYPVVYLLYGDQTEGYFAETVFSLERLEGGAEIPQFILVGIHNTDRYGNLLPVKADGSPGGADTFMDFLEKELFPFVEAEYRTKPYRLLIGPQAGGTFGLYALGRRPGIFNAFILENPFWAHENCRNAVKAGLREYAAAPPPAGRTVFVSTFDRSGFQDHSETTKALVDFLREYDAIKPAALRIRRRHLEDPTFVPSLELKQPLRTIFEGFYPPPEKALNSLADIRAYYREAGGRFGFEVDPPAFILAIKSDEFSRTGRAEAAREVLEYSLSLRPEDTNASFRLGNMFFGAWDLDRAEAIFRGLQERRPDPFFASRLEAIARMRKGSAALALSQALTDGLPSAKARLEALEKAAEAGTYFDEREFNTLGYRLLGQGRFEEALFIFDENARRHPDSWNAWDSLAEVHFVRDDLDKAAEFYKKSVELNPENRNGKNRLSLIEGSRLNAAGETREPLRFAAGSRTGLQGPYLGQKPPGLQPEVFAPGIVSSAKAIEFSITFSPDGRELYFTRRIDPGPNTIMVSRWEKDGWTAPEEAAFNEGFPSNEPHITPDGRKLYFGCNRPRPGVDRAEWAIWVVERTASGAWGKPRYHGPGMYVSTARNGNLYMTDVAAQVSPDRPVVVYPWTGDGYGAPQRLDGGVNAPAAADHGHIASDESYIIFDSPLRPGSQGGYGDLYICFRNPDGSFGEARNLGDTVNTPAANFCPMVTPDGKYIFYGTYNDIFWVSADILKPLRAK